MEKLKWILIIALLEQLANCAFSQMVFPESDEDPRFNSFGGNGGTTGTKTITRTFTGEEPMTIKRTYQTGSLSSSQANAGSMAYNNPAFLGQERMSGGGSYSSASASSYSSAGVRCSTHPKSPKMGKLVCMNAGVSCTASCMPDYRFPNGRTSLNVVCNNGRWLIESFDLNEIPNCEAICEPPCLNKGICIEPGKCNCPQNFMGPSCESEKKYCTKSAPMGPNSARSCSESKCTITCKKGYKFPDGSLSANLNCVDGEWVPEISRLAALPNCAPTCDPQCQNGGKCISYNVCQCSKEFRGKYCQWNIERCSPKKLLFNGSYKCSGNADSLSCSLSCPNGIEFEFKPAEVYTCRYDIGEFSPRQVPKCIFGEGYQVVYSDPQEKYEMSITNRTMSGQSGGSTQQIIKSGGKKTKTITKKVITETEITEVEEEGEDQIITENEEFLQTPGLYIMELSQDLSVTYREPKKSVCMTWNGNKIKTFDGVTFGSELVCSHTLVQDLQDGMFHIILRSCPYDAVQPCPHALEVFNQNEQFTFEIVGGQMKMFTTKKEIPMPVQMAGLRVTRSGMDVRIVLDAIPITITWDSKKYVQVDASVSIWNRTAGLCGTLDGYMSNDFMSNDGVIHKLPSTFVDSWRAPTMDKIPAKCIRRSQKVTKSACDTSAEEKANLVCTDLYRNSKMTNCLKFFNMDVLMKNCIDDYCGCKNTYERTECICNGLGALVKDCRFRGVTLEDGWRDWQICPLNCTNGRVYKSCGPLSEPSCGSAIESDSFNCREGCFCPEGTILNDGACIKREQCPCKLKGKSFAPKAQITRDCNTCKCVGGNWKCTSITCGSRCSSIGDPHYTTFDGKRFDFMGKCSYYLMKTDAITVEAENVACSGTISESMNFLPSFSTELPSCTKSLTITFNDDAGQQRIIKLKQGGFVLVDGYELPKLPRDLSNGAVKIRQPSSSFVIVDFKDGVKVWWDGTTRAYIDAPASYRGKTQGLCGTFDSNMQNDFLTPEGDIETTVQPFAKKWQTSESCDFLNDKAPLNPCSTNVENKAQAEKICSKLRDKAFLECHLFVDPDLFYEDCLYDVCACKGDINHCACPILASYAAECARQGIILNWRYNVSECAISCPNGQVFEQCGEACTRTCTDLHNEEPCNLQCVEGCRCPKGQVLDENNECVTIGMCKCAYKNMEFQPGYKEVRMGKSFLELCMCSNGKWLCIKAQDGDSTKYPAAGDMAKKCSAMRNEVFTTCEPAEPVTCKNMHLNISSTTALCRPGCTCKEGYVLDSILKECVLPEKCSCHHSGRAYQDGERIQEDCNTCFCRKGKWDCTTKPCAGTCSSWGDSHFTTFDGREFDFQGVCSYVLAKGKLSDGRGFSVIIQNVLCGSNGVTCSKTMNINVLGNEPESISLSSDLPVPGIKSKLNGNSLKDMLVYRSGIFLTVEVPNIGLLLKWDRGTRVYLKLENRWKNKVQGLCGNFNYDSLDDFMNPSFGIESSPTIFGHSWKLEDSCLVPTDQVDSCKLNPQRKTWAQKKCGLLKSNVFTSCHSEVPVESFYKRCIFDTCSCDQGGDCECLCTAIGAYAYACSSKGVNIRWRTPDLCPMQCDPTCSNYNPCVPSCPQETCDNLMHPSKSERLCNSDVCVEGCLLKGCPTGSIYKNDSFSECVPKSECKPICLQANGITYLEGDIMTIDSCHTCKCTRGKSVCTGLPCEESSSPYPDYFDTTDIPKVCKTGWSEWINQDMSDKAVSSNVKTSKSNYFKENDFESLQNLKHTTCKSEFYAAIECRTVVGHKSPKSTGQDVECTLNDGLVCIGQCFDYEIRVFCDCGDVTSPVTSRKPLVPTIRPVTSSLIPGNITTTKPLPKKDDCPVGYVWNECATPCRRACKYYGYLLMQSGKCSASSSDCVPGCSPIGSILKCDTSKLWRDSKTCVDVNDCTCVGPNNEQLKPGQVVKVSECQTCQCLKNEYICAETPCNRTYTIKKITTSTERSTVTKPKYLSACDATQSQLEHPNSCYKFLQCLPKSDGTYEFAEMVCGTGTMYNPESMNCDWPANVFQVKKSCEATPGDLDTLTTPKSFEKVITKWPTTPKPKSATKIMISTPSPAFASETTRKIVRIPPYYIRICDPNNLQVEHPESCYKFLHCQPSPNGSYIYAEKTCGPDMMFNPVLTICDWPDNVRSVKPICGKIPGPIQPEIWDQITEKPQIPTTDKTGKLISTPSPAFASETTRRFVRIPPYYIRICDPNNHHVEHPESCFKFLHCQPSPNGSYIYAEKTCGPDMMFNPVLTICDWPDNVRSVKPLCGKSPGLIQPEVWDPITEMPQFTSTFKTTSLPKTVGPVTTPRPSVTLVPVIIVPSTISPPIKCEEKEMIPLLKSLPDSAFSASSSYGNAFKPEAARLNNKPKDGTSGAWIPKSNDLDQYLQITFPQAVPVYGVIIQGHPMYNQYVTSYKIIHSYDGLTFHVYEDLANRPKIFSGSADARTPVQNTFKVPIEAKIFRIYPLSWNESPSLRLELLGCQRKALPTYEVETVLPITSILTTTKRPELSTKTIETLFVTPPPIITTSPDVLLCDDPMGIESGKIGPSQIKFSSIKDAGSVKTKVRKNPIDIIKLSSARGWMPLADNTNEYIMIDFLSPRNLTGMITKGGEYGWVKSFKVLYSKDNLIWNNILDANGKPQEFLANVNAENTKSTFFKMPIHAQYLKVQPLKWFSAIELKLEPLGCFRPYPIPTMKNATRPPTVEIVTPSSCNVCKGALLSRKPIGEEDICTCPPPQYWSGSECVSKAECPCYEGHISYEVGEFYQTENCSECVCKIGGSPDCKPKSCPACPKGQKRVSPGSCSCKCEKCPPETILCQTSGECIEESSWCDGIQDCPDDEMNCTQSGKPVIIVSETVSKNITKKCPVPTCPEGFLVKERKAPRKSKMLSSRFANDDDDPPQQQYYYIKAKYTATYEAMLPISTSKQDDINSEQCIEFICVPIVHDPTDVDYGDETFNKTTRCSEPKCPPGYIIRLQILTKPQQCAKFTCEVVVENDAVCNVTGRTFNTFDSTEFKYDICSHLLARDVADEKWNVIMRKNCSTGNNICSKEIEIKDKVTKYTLILYPSLKVNLDGYDFTVEQLQNSNQRKSFMVSKNGDYLTYESYKHGFWLIFDRYGDARLGVSPIHASKVDGLCGFYNHDKLDDKRTPIGKIADSTVEFGDSWSVSQTSREDCEPHVCPKALQNAAWDMCNLVKNGIFKQCATSVDPISFASKCIETACDCLLTASNGTTISSKDLQKYTKECKCSMLKNYVVECMAADETVYLETWRSVHSCEATCPAPFVHKDCYRKKCEMTCNNLQSSDCSVVPGTCFSGCYCPEGTVRKDSTCIPISQCRDCICDGFGKSQYITYDKKNFTFDGNCTYLLTRDITLPEVPSFQIYTTVGPCDKTVIRTNQATCTQALHLIYGTHIVHIQKGLNKSLDLLVDGIKLKSLPYNQNWIKISEQGKSLNILLPESQVELISMFEMMSFSIKVPSVKYGSKMVGICGDCDGKPENDMITNPVKTTLPSGKSDLQNFALSWMADDPKLGLNEDPNTCYVDDVRDCLPLPPETDPCFKILDDEIFSQCHFVVDPIMYVTACQQDMCKTGPSQMGSCDSIAAYVRECARSGICIDWRRNGFCTMKCVAPLAYNACGCSETCQSVQAKEELIKSSPAIRDPKNIAKMRSICSTSLTEGCFCPNGMILHNGKCLKETECRACDDKGHLPGDIWHPDVCTTCSCRNDSKIECQKIQCPAQQTICGVGFMAVEISPEGGCCKKYNCVQEPIKATPTSCPKLTELKCGTDLITKKINDTDGCPKYICDCIPKNKCRPIQNYTTLDPGFKKIIDTSGCCPVAKLICENSLCPAKPPPCTQPFHVLDKIKSASDKVCCDEYQCRPPSNNCVATVGGQAVLKKIDETWTTDDVCEKAQCAFDTNGNPIIKKQRVVCNIICQAGYELKPIPNKCCGECIKTKCIVDNKLFDIGAQWSSSDNCTTFSCDIKDGQTFVSAMLATCPDISTCPSVLRYSDGCCERCKMEPLSKTNCLPESLAESETLGLIQVEIPPHGKCKNINSVRGITQCYGSCNSGTKFDPLTLHQIKNCDCCSVSEVKEIPVKLICADNYEMIKNLNVPSACSCSKCESDETRLLKMTKAAF